MKGNKSDKTWVPAKKQVSFELGVGDVSRTNLKGSYSVEFNFTHPSDKVSVLNPQLELSITEKRTIKKTLSELYGEDKVKLINPTLAPSKRVAISTSSRARYVSDRDRAYPRRQRLLV